MGEALDIYVKTVEIQSLFFYIWHMNVKWYTSTLFITLLTLLGVANLQHNNVPNQEIVLQFAIDEVTSKEALNVIAIVKEQLQTIGVDNIQIQKQENGQLKITYYSDADVASVKEIFSKEELELGYISYNEKKKNTKSPSDENSISYNLDIYEIQNGNDAELGLEGKSVLKLNHEYDRFSNPNVFISIGKIDDDESSSIVKVAYKLHKSIAIAIDNWSHTIPEVRAGPNS